MRYDPDGALNEAIAEINDLRARLAEVEAERDGAREALTHLQVIADQRETDRALAVAAVQPLAARLAKVERALDDEEANLADDGARLSHAVVRRVRAAARGEGDQ